MPGSLCISWHEMLPLAPAPGVGCLQAKCPAIAACLHPSIWAALSCSSIYKGRNTETDENIAGECGLVLLALTLVLARN